MRCEMNIVAMAKGGQRYVFLYDDQSCETLVEVFEKYARNPDLNFSSRDAAVLRRKVRESAARYRRFHPSIHREL